MNDASDFKGRRVLVVDDNQDAADILAELLRALGHDATSVSDPREAAPAAREFRPDLILLDVLMPELDGFAVLAQLREDPLHARTAVVALTGLGQEEQVRQIYAAGFRAHLMKPTSLEALEEVLQSMH